MHGIYDDFQEVRPWEQWFSIAVTDATCLAHSWLNVNMLHPFERTWLNNREKWYLFWVFFASSCAEGQAESFVGKADGRWHFLWKSWEREKTGGRSMWWAKGTSSFGKAGALQQSRRWYMQQGASPTCLEDWQGWMHLKKLVQCDRTKPRLDGKELSIRTQEAEVRFVCRFLKFNPKFPWRFLVMIYLPVKHGHGVRKLLCTWTHSFSEKKHSSSKSTAYHPLFWQQTSPQDKA